jgi:hypothetical protein
MNISENKFSKTTRSQYPPLAISTGKIDQKIHPGIQCTPQYIQIWYEANANTSCIYPFDLEADRTAF